MKIISDLHIHSKYSRACSKDLDIKNLEKYAKIKGINLLGTGDFTHPKWILELKNNLKENGTGVLRTVSGFPFLLTSEVSLIYSQDGKGRRVHVVLFAKSYSTVEKITQFLLTKGRVDYDGRPIFKIPCPEFVKQMKNIDDTIEIIPAHIWTPWFSMFGSSSGFNTVEECFLDQAKNIHALETGLSSDPQMNWRLTQLDRFSLVSFSDSHSFWPWRLGREATIFEFDSEITYDKLIDALHTKKGLYGTIEVDPGYGKYHYDGHRNCNVHLSPKESIKLNDKCPVCRRQLTIGVEHRVEELADRELGYMPKNAPKSIKLIPLSEIISGVLQSSVTSKKVTSIFYELIARFENENKILMELPIEVLKEVCEEKIAEVIIRVRNQDIKVLPGYDGVYGVPILRGDETYKAGEFDDEENPKTYIDEKKEELKKEKLNLNQPIAKQKGLSEFF
ncbi:MAG: endonuclease Q family protein [archaeon]